MTREEFKRRLMAQRVGSASDALVEACLELQIIFGELDADRILKMPSTRFDLLAKRIVEKRDTKQPVGRKEVGVFGYR